MQILKKNKRKRYIRLAIAVLFLIILCFGLNNSLKIRTYTIESESITEEVRIALLTDLHSCKYGENQADLIKAINDENPDIILLGGDICDDIMPNDNTEILLNEIADKYPCYYVTGNHEYWSNDIETILDLFYSYGVKILSGSFDTIEIRGQKVNICGITDPDSGLDMYNQLEELANVHENGNYTILLAHRPEEIENYKGYGFDLVLSGHTHGGQWRIPGIMNGLYAPNQGIFAKYAGGQYEFDNLSMIVSRGLSKENTKIPRIFNQPELVIVKLV